MSPAASSRWCPTPEQLMMLEELYRTGIRTPNASQIQRITAHLSFYGKIEGKNVFYWFQNHKARDRQKLRRKFIKQLQQQQLYYPLGPPSSSFFLPPSPAFAPLPHQGTFGGMQREMVNEEWRVEIPENVQMMRMNSCDWMVTRMEVGPSNSPKPLETLDLFPISKINESPNH